MLRCNDETTEQDALHLTIERQWKRDSVQRNFWRDGGWGKFYVPVVQYASSIGPAEIPDDIGPAPIAFAQYHRAGGFIVITTPLDPSYRWIIPLRYNTFEIIETPLINPANRERVR